MKLKVNRELSGGLYHVNFAVSDFTPDEVKKMGSFGVPVIQMLVGGVGLQTTYKIGITQISPQYKTSFPTEEQAKAYEQKIVTEIREVMKAVRERTDNFSSTQEVDV